MTRKLLMCSSFYVFIANVLYVSTHVLFLSKAHASSSPAYSPSSFAARSNEVTARFALRPLRAS